MPKIPVILDTDLGSDIDDSWAIAYMLKCPELDVKLITTATGDTTYRAKLCARILKAGNRTDIPIGIGIALGAVNEKLIDYANEMDLATYPGKIIPDGVQAMVDTIMASGENVTLISIGPTPNIARALYLEPRIAQKAAFVGMHGSLRMGYNGQAGKADEEYNVAAYPYDAARTFTAGWDMTITPLDTCGTVKLSGERYLKILASQDPMLKEVVRSYQAWAKDLKLHDNPLNSSTVLFDTVAVYLAMDDRFLKMERIGIRTQWGLIKEDPAGKMMNVATEWKDKEAFLDHLTERLIS